MRDPLAWVPLEEAKAVSRDTDPMAPEAPAKNWLVLTWRGEGAKAAAGDARGAGDAFANLFAHYYRRGARGGAAAAPVLGPPPARNRQRCPFVGTIRLPGLPLIRVETRRGGTRRGTDPDGKPWSVVMPAHYGEFARTQGTDGDAVDVFVGPNRHAAHAYVVHVAVAGTGRYDEDKVCVAFDTREDVEATLRAAYNRPGMVLGIRKLTIPEIAEWLTDPARRGRKITAGREMAKAVVVLTWPGPRAEAGKAIDRRGLRLVFVTRQDGVRQRYWRRPFEAGAGSAPTPANAAAADLRTRLGDRYRDPEQVKDVRIIADVDAAATRIFGRPLRRAEWAGLVGAGDGDEVEVFPVPTDQHARVAIYVKGDGWKAKRTVARDQRGRVIVQGRIDSEREPRFALRVLASQIVTALRLDVGALYAKASGAEGDTGFYVWPRYGYVPQGNPVGPVRRAWRFADDSGRKALVAAGFGPTSSLPDVMATQAGRDWWKRRGVGHRAVFRLDLNGPCLQTLKGVLEE